jgi:hypothetical protein
MNARLVAGAITAADRSAHARAAQASPVVRERARANSRWCRLVSRVAGERQVLMAGCMRLVADRGGNRRGDFVGHRRHDRVDEPLSRAAQAGTAASSSQGAHACDAGGG